MVYIYDILVNFCDNELLYDFYEWDKDDNIENVKRIKLVHITKQLLDDLILYDGNIDKDFLLKIFKTCEIYDGKKVKIMDYVVLVSDGERVLGIEFNKEGVPIYKSKLLPDEEDEIALLASNLELSDISFNKKEKILENRFLTRKELFIHNFLLKEIEECYKKKSYGKLKYLYQEYFDKNNNSYKNMKEELIDSINNMIDDKHIELYKLLKLTKQKKEV